MAYKKIQLFDASFLKGTATSEELTAHLNERIVYLQGICGGSNRCEISSVDTSFINTSNATSIKTTRTITSSSSDNNTSSSGTEIETATLAVGVSEDTITKWLVLIDYNKTIDV